MEGFYESIIGISRAVWKKLLGYTDTETVLLRDTETVLVKIEHMLNSHPLTYMPDENSADSITPYDLLYGHDVNRKNSDINHFRELS